MIMMSMTIDDDDFQHDITPHTSTRSGLGSTAAYVLTFLQLFAVGAAYSSEHLIVLEIQHDMCCRW